MEFNLTSTGRLIYDPDMFKVATKPAPWWLIVETDKGIVDYYNYMIQKRCGIKMLKPSWGSHISVVRGEKISQDYKHLWKAHNGKKIQFKYSNHVRFNHEYWWVDVQSEELLDMREALGLRRKPIFSFHITVGKMPLELRGKILFDDKRL